MPVKFLMSTVGPFAAIFVATAALGHPGHEAAGGAHHMTHSWLHAVPLVLTGLVAGFLSHRVGAATAVFGAMIAVVGLSAAAHLGFGYSTAFLLDGALAATGLTVAGYGAGSLISRRLANRRA